MVEAEGTTVLFQAQQGYHIESIQKAHLHVHVKNGCNNSLLITLKCDQMYMVQ